MEHQQEQEQQHPSLYDDDPSSKEEGSGSGGEFGEDPLSSTKTSSFAESEEEIIFYRDSEDDDYPSTNDDSPSSSSASSSSSLEEEEEEYQEDIEQGTVETVGDDDSDSDSDKPSIVVVEEQAVPLMMSEESERRLGDKKRKKWFLVGGIFAILAVVAAFVTAAVCVSVACGGNKKLTAPTAPTVAPTVIFTYSSRAPANIVQVPPTTPRPTKPPQQQAPTAAPIPPPPPTGLDRTGVVVYLGSSEANITLPAHTVQARRIENSPQALASNWLATEYSTTQNDLNTMQEWRKQQLFALASLQFTQQPTTTTSESGGRGRGLQQQQEEALSWWLDASTPECDWIPPPAMKCTDDGRVKELSIQLDQGSIPPEVQLLSSLESLTIRGTTEGGGTQQPIPLEYIIPNERRWGVHKQGMVGFLGNLKFLSITNSTLRGFIPPTIKRLVPNLRHIDLSGNDLTGTIPNNLFAFEELSHLDLSYNVLTGPIPGPTTDENDGDDDNGDGGYPITLSRLYLNDNRLNGTIPPFDMNSKIRPGAYKDLIDVRFQNNLLTGTMPFDFCSFRKLGPFSCVYDNDCLEELWADCGGGGGASPKVTCSLGSCCSKCFPEGQEVLSNATSTGGEADGPTPEEEVVDDGEDEIQDEGIQEEDNGTVIVEALFTGPIPSGNYPSSLEFLYLEGNPDLGGSATDYQSLQEARFNFNLLTGTMPQTFCDKEVWADCMGNPPSVDCQFPGCCNRCYQSDMRPAQRKLQQQPHDEDNDK